MGRRTESSVMTNHLKELRGLRGLSQAALAKSSGVSRQAINSIESGRYLPNAMVAIRIARALGRRVEEIFELPDIPTECEVVPVEGAPLSGDRVAVARVGERLIAYTMEGSRNFQGGFAEANGIALGGEGRVQLLSSPSDLERTALLLGCDPSLGILAEQVSRHASQVRLRWIQSCSQSALRGIESGAAHVAGTHLLGDSNVSNAREAVLSKGGILVAYASWEQGLVVAPGNPKGIGAIEDIAGPRIRFVNREEGSGSRMLVDHLLGEAGIPPALVSGYDRIRRSHLAVTQMVADGAADAGVSLRALARVQGLDFIPLAEVRFDLVIPRDHLGHPGVEILLDLLQTRSFRMKLAALPGYDVTHTGEVLQEFPRAA